MITASDIESLFAAQLSKIENLDLRAKVVKAWVVGCQRGGYTSVEQLQAMPFTLLTNTRGVNFIEHTIAVTEGALALARCQVDTYRQMPYAVNYDRLIAGGLLHDVGKLLEIEQDGSGGYRKSRNGMCARHPISGAILAAEVGLDDETVNTVACHAKEGDGRPQVLETVLIHQSDFATFNPLVMLEKSQLIQ